VAGALGLFWLVADGVIYDQGPRWLLIFPWRDALLGLSFSMLLFAVTSTRTWIRPLFEWRPVAWIGFISYSIFLVHQSTIWYLSELLKKHWNLSGGPHLAITCTVGLAITIIVSYVFFRLFEKPFMTIPGQKEKSAAKGAPVSKNPEKLPAIVPQAGKISPVIVQAGKLAPAPVTVVAPSPLAESVPAPTNLN
jgi:peptidoglycan/LPS O-acetylase OafA/YrhL